jgi:hypothetical protein
MNPPLTSWGYVQELRAEVFESGPLAAVYAGATDTCSASTLYDLMDLACEEIEELVAAVGPCNHSEPTFTARNAPAATAWAFRAAVVNDLLENGDSELANIKQQLVDLINRGSAMDAADQDRMAM